MNTASFAYLVMVLAAYAVFMGVLGAVWLRCALEPRKMTSEPKPMTQSARRSALLERRKAA